jgi:hypothetical protein
VKIIRRIGPRLRVETEMPPHEARLGASWTAELSKIGDVFTGKVENVVVCTFRLTHPELGYLGDRLQRCHFEFPIRIYSLTATRIEGIVEDYPERVPFECRTCSFSGSRERIPFVWLRE